MDCHFDIFKMGHWGPKVEILNFEAEVADSLGADDTVPKVRSAVRVVSSPR